MTEYDTTTAKPERAWVWWCNEESIAEGKISALAILETFAAVGLWWWLAMRFNWSIFSFVALFAAPLLLLRSELSVRVGVIMLRRYWHRKDDNIVILEHIFLYALMLVLTFSHLGDGWIIQLVGEGHISRPFKALFIMLLLAPLFLSIFGQKDIFLRLLFSNGTNLPLLFSQYGILFHSQWIRLFATITHPLHGVQQLPKNWRESLWVIDSTHPPELIPLASKVDFLFSVDNLRIIVLKTNEINLKLKFLMLVPMLYLPALAYRWSLKASAWLWFPLILLLKPPFYGMTELDLRERTTLSVKGFEWVALRVLAGLVLLWLLAALIPSLLSYVLLIKDWGEVIQKSLALKTPPPFGIRYIALWFFAVLGLWFAKSCNALKNVHNEWVEKPDQPADSASEAFARFQRRARIAERLRIALIATLVIGVYAGVAAWLHTAHLAYAEQHFPVPWLWQIL